MTELKEVLEIATYILCIIIAIYHIDKYFVQKKLAEAEAAKEAKNINEEIKKRDNILFIEESEPHLYKNAIENALFLGYEMLHDYNIYIDVNGKVVYTALLIRYNY